MDVGIDVLWAVELNDPINSWEIYTSGSDISGEEHRRLFLDELIINGRPLVLFLFSMELV